MITNKFKIGDLVVRKTGGPKMVIDEIVGSRLKCIWFEIFVLKEKKFSAADLKKVA